jgi:hypothetical protein
VFADLMEAEGIRRGADHVRQLTILGGGAAWIWNVASSKFPEATQIVDLYHAREHPHDLARLLEFMLLDRKDEWLAARIEDLDYGDIDGICRTARAYPLEGTKKDDLDTPLGYFENNAPACAITGSASAACQVCTGPPAAQMPSPPSAASRPAGPKTGFVTHRATRRQPPDQPSQLNDPFPALFCEQFI